MSTDTRIDGKYGESGMNSNEKNRTGPAEDAPDPISSESLLRGQNEIAILHEGQLYRLRRTAKGKLIMTK